MQFSHRGRLLYHNGAALYRNETAADSDLYDLNGRRTNRARIVDDSKSVFVPYNMWQIGQFGR
jgi:hypothetical protein